MLFPRPRAACALALACAACAAVPALALDAGQAFGTGAAFGDTRTVALRLAAAGTVTAIDARARLLQVQSARGALTFRLDPVVANARLIRPGERVQVDYVAAFVLSPLRDGDDAATDDRAARASADPGSLADSYAHPVSSVADVLSIDKEALVVRLRGRDGEVTAYPVNDRSALAGMRVGDPVLVVMNQAVAVRVTPLRR